MKKLSYFKILSFYLLVLLLVGCKPAFGELTAPPENMAIDDVTRINLRALDLDQLSKSDLKEIDGIKFPLGTMGYEMEYRYPQQPIKVKVIKFTSETKLKDFWEEWLSIHQISANLVSEFIQMDDKHSQIIYAWQKGSWLTYIQVPENNKDLSDKVKAAITNHYYDLAKKQ